MSHTKVAARIAVAASVVTLVAAVAGFVLTLVLNAFVLDKYDAYGEVPVPGSGSVHLPAGQVTVSFHTQVIGSPSSGGLPIPQLGMSIDPPAGVAEPTVTESIGGTTTVNNDARRRVWLIQVPAEGAYKITTDGLVSGFISPRLAFGHSSPYGYMVWVFVGLFVVGLGGLVASLLWAARSPRAVSTGWLASGQPAVSPVVPATTDAPPSSSPGSALYLPSDEGVRVAQLKTLAALRDSGALTQAEFDAEKRRILDRR
jgi:hypothetical protein